MQSESSKRQCRLVQSSELIDKRSNPFWVWSIVYLWLAFRRGSREADEPLQSQNRKSRSRSRREKARIVWNRASCSRSRDEMNIVESERAWFRSTWESVVGVPASAWSGTSARQSLTVSVLFAARLFALVPHLVGWSKASGAFTSPAAILRLPILSEFLVFRHTRTRIPQNTVNYRQKKMREAKGS